MKRIIASIAAAMATLAVCHAQTYYVYSAGLSHSGGWPSVHWDTRSGPFQVDGYTWDVAGAGQQVTRTGQLQEDNSHYIVDGQYTLTGQCGIFGSATLNDADYTMERENITITFKIRCSYASTPPTPGVPAFDVRCAAYSDVFAINSPNYNHGRATAWYIPYDDSSPEEWTAEAELPGGVEIDAPGFVDHRVEYGSAPSSWTSVGTNLWEVTVTVPVPAAWDDPDQDVYVFGEGSSPYSGQMMNAWSYAVATYEYRCISLGNINLQDSF